MPEEKLRPTYTFTEDRLAELRAVVPEAFEEGSLNWDTLRDLLAPHLADESPDAEHFGLSWPGKREARRLAAKPSGNTLRPAPGEGVNEDTTRNLYLEGDNLEVLKLLQKSYAGQVKMIYIDPPYNTGNDFVYKDNFTEPSEDYLRRTGQVGEGGELLTSNPKSDGRFHTNWLNMIYPRLRLARTLLRDDGVIFVSIDDNENYNLRLVLNEVFGEENHIATFIWNTSGHTDNQLEVKITHEYVVCYRKTNAGDVFNFVVDPSTTEGSNLWRGFAENSITKNGPGNPPSIITLRAGFPCSVEELQLPPTSVNADFFGAVKDLGHISRSITDKFNVAYPVRLDPIVVRDFALQQDCRVYSGWANANKLRAFVASGCSPLKEEDGDISFYLSARGVVYYKKTRQGAKNILSVLRNFGTTETARSLLEAKKIYFSYPKPVDLIRYLARLVTTPNCVVMDFFAGSGTTGEAIFQLNASQKEQCSFILVQAPEPTTAGSLARQHSFHTVSKLCEARLKVAAATTMGAGYRVLTLGPSNFRAWRDYTGDSVSDLQQQFDLFEESPLAEGWTPDGLLTEVLLLEGFPLDSTVTPQVQWKQNVVSCITSPACAHRLWTCFDETLHPDTVNGLTLSTGDVFICRDSALDDNAKLRLSQTGTLKTI